ncbi:MAG: 4Fe-4S binding protein [Actinomycetia bacterium]|nr:4Fe-4S binding protein [Actinomycetes bacterium]
MSDSQSIQASLRSRAAELLASDQVAELIGWGAGRFPDQTTPLFITQADQAEGLVYSEYCQNTLGKYAITELSELVADQGKLAICVRGCESRGINRMLKDNQIERDRLYLLGIPCSGMKNRQSGELLSKCMNCSHKNPVIYDELLGETVAEGEPDRFGAVCALEECDRASREQYFDAAFDRCIRCYACREVCPVCTCRECFVDQHEVGWQGKQGNTTENRFYSLTRAFHISDRCVECGECERACPMGLPLMVLNRKLVKDLDDLFQAGEAGLDAVAVNSLGTYDVADVEEFM